VRGQNVRRKSSDFMFKNLIIILMTFRSMLVCGADWVFLKALVGLNYEESWGLIKTQDGGYVMTGYMI